MNQLLNQTLFENNGMCGYLLKSPFHLGLTPASSFSMNKHVNLQIISGHQIPKKPSGDKDIVDPYVAVYLVSTGSPDKEIKLFQTKVVPNNGLNPVWDTSASFSYWD